MLTTILYVVLAVLILTTLYVVGRMASSPGKMVQSYARWMQTWGASRMSGPQGVAA